MFGWKKVILKHNRIVWKKELTVLMFQYRSDLWNADRNKAKPLQYPFKVLDPTAEELREQPQHDWSTARP